MPEVNSKILKWARNTAGLSIENACRKLQIKEAKGLSAENRLIDYETGVDTLV